MDRIASPSEIVAGELGTGGGHVPVMTHRAMWKAGNHRGCRNCLDKESSIVVKIQARCWLATGTDRVGHSERAYPRTCLFSSMRILEMRAADAIVYVDRDA